MSNKQIKLIECPRDAMQGMHDFVPTDLKAEYINKLLKVGFDTIDFGSFVSPKAIPQMADTKEVLKKLDLSSTTTKLLAIIANLRGAEEGCQFEKLTYFGFPFSISETFQLRNTNSSIADSLVTVEKIQQLSIKNKKKLVIYISMGFGNPYGDEWSFDIASHWVQQISELDVEIIALSDTVGVSTPENIQYMVGNLSKAHPNIGFGVHLHSTPNSWKEKIEAAYLSGCRRFDSAVRGFGGCPMAKDKLTGNIATENVIDYFQQQNIDTGLNMDAWEDALLFSQRIFI
ncbi:hydroxymethylglutaryl-CoA lyase [Solitalea koreensis]|uniref:Hydroxymethylglutaryl-CoA lyase n=1 Tax=Solitalea koreensis TaxID=543615 RepID=A0A521D8A0_9SPHI|nr:hydroxymethylglutaryl-CoA lyase [Solitalea koreensis]SMO67832.1 hydroxymethylglutaryl-CoA lyase [Solitalea koreensis]